MKRKGIAIFVFGSVARGEAKIDSDIDFLVEFRSDASLLDQAGLQSDLEDLLGFKVDVISRGGLKAKDDLILKEAIQILCLTP